MGCPGAGMGWPGAGMGWPGIGIIWGWPCIMAGFICCIWAKNWACMAGFIGIMPGLGIMAPLNWGGGAPGCCGCICII